MPGAPRALCLTRAFHARVPSRVPRRGVRRAPRSVRAAMATDVPRIAVGQMSASSDVEKNLEVVADLCARAKDRGCAMLFLPECFAFIGVKGTDALAVMEPLDGPLLGRYRELAARHRLWLSLGGFAEKGPDRDRRFNAHVIVNDAGEIQASYRKIHLFDVDMGDVNGPVLMESSTAAAGETLVTCDSPAGKLGLTVCYDLRFPEMFARLRYELGCEVMLVPSAFTKPTGQAHWETLLRARAIETQSYVVAAAQAGVHSEGRASHGHAMIVDPWGKVVAELDGEETGIAVADVDLGYLKDVRSRIPVETHRRDIASFPVERR
jgi:predicted amidohydrolase